MAGLLGPNFQDLTLRNSRVPRRITSGVTGRWSQPTKNVFPIIRGLVKPLVHIIAGAALTGELMPVFDGLAPRSVRCSRNYRLSSQAMWLATLSCGNAHGYCARSVLGRGRAVTQATT